MKLYYSPTSPFVRKVMIVAIERGLDAAIERLPIDFKAPDPSLVQNNPLRKVPTLILNDGSVLYDSPVICEYLDQLPGGRHLFPIGGPERWRQLRLQALADGASDAAVLWRMETMRPVEAERSQAWIERQKGVVQRSVAALEKEAPTLSGELLIGTASVVAALGFLDLRFDDLGWRNDAPVLARWFAAMGEHSAVRETAPPKG